MGFDVSKWNKQRYLAEAGEKSPSSIAKAIDNAIPEGYGEKDLAKDIAYILSEKFGSQTYKSFMNVLHDELGMEPLNEAETFDMDDDSLLSTYENKLKAHDWYYYMSDDSRKYNSGEMEAKTLSDIKTELGKRGLADKAKELFTKYEKTL